MSSESVVRRSTELAQPDSPALPAADPVAPPELEEEVADERLTVASQWQLIWWRVREHKIAVACGVLLIVVYIVAMFAEFFAPYDPLTVNAQYTLVPPLGMTF